MPASILAAQPGSLDSSFNPPINSGGVVYAVALQNDQKILIGGAFTSIGIVQITNVARLNPDGSLDASFNPRDAANSGYVNAIAIQSDGKIILGGFFASSSGSKPSLLARLNADGSEDFSFNQLLYLDGPVNAIAIQSDGQILFGGAFNFVAGYPRRNLARIRNDGTLDTSFDACVASSSGSGATSIAIQSDGKILAGGRFTFSTGDYRDGIARLSQCGELDVSFASPPGVNLGGTAYAIALRDNRDALLTGNFTNFYGFSRGGVVLLTTNGIPDLSFSPGTGVDNGATVYTAALQYDGRAILAGEFTEYNSLPCFRVGRVNRDGSLDATFNAGSGPNNSVSSIVIQPDGKILVAGKFSSLSGAPRNGIARLIGDPLSHLGSPSFLPDGRITFSFSGLSGTSYAIQSSSNLVDWSLLTNLVATNVPITILDPTPSPPPRRFYRAVSL